MKISRCDSSIDFLVETRPQNLTRVTEVNFVTSLCTSHTVHKSRNAGRSLSRLAFVTCFALLFFRGVDFAPGCAVGVRFLNRCNRRSRGSATFYLTANWRRVCFGRDYRNEVRLTLIQIGRSGDAQIDWQPRFGLHDGLASLLSPSGERWNGACRGIGQSLANREDWRMPSLA